MTCRYSGILGAASWPGKRSPWTWTTTTPTPATPTRTILRAGRDSRLTARSRHLADLGPLGCRGSLLENLVELDHVVLDKGLSPGLWYEGKRPAVGVAKDDPDNPRALRQLFLQLSGSLYTVHKFLKPACSHLFSHR